MTTKAIHCAMLSSFTVNPLVDLANARLDHMGLKCEWFVSPFNQYSQAILAEHSELVAFQPQVVILAVAIEDLMCQLPSNGTHGGERMMESSRRIADFLGLVRKLAERIPAAEIFVQDFLPLAPEANRLLAAQSRLSLRQIALEGNYLLEKLVSESATVRVVSLVDAFRALPHAALFDPRFFYVAKMRLGRQAMEALAEHYCRLIKAYAGVRKKCLVLDLDNTLWGGILGEDGPDNLLLGDDGPGKAFQDMQRILLEYYETGTLLAICSKNDETLAMAAIREHPGMILRPNHFAAFRINWEDKASNLCALAKELNLGLDSLVFLDDSPFECEEVQRLAPQVTVLQMPEDPSDYPSFVAQLPYFDALRVTEDDRRRGQMYIDDRERRSLEQTAGSLEDFLRGLKIQVTVRRADRKLIARLAQLSQRTNQFNLTTRRYTESDLLALSLDGNWRLYGVLASDRIGDSGISGAAFVHVDPATATARLDTFLVSCRVLGRGIESAFLAGLCSDLQNDGIAALVAEYLPTEKNGMARDFLPNQGFQATSTGWRRALAKGPAGCPDWIELQLN